MVSEQGGQVDGDTADDEDEAERLRLLIAAAVSEKATEDAALIAQLRERVQSLETPAQPVRQPRFDTSSTATRPMLSSPRADRNIVSSASSPILSAIRSGTLGSLLPSFKIR